MQWIRRCKQEELSLIDNFSPDEDDAEKMKLYELFMKQRKGVIVNPKSGSEAAKSEKSVKS